MTPEQARTMFLDHCKPGSAGTLERYGEKAAVAAILEVAGERDELLAALGHILDNPEARIGGDIRAQARAAIAKAHPS